MSERSEMHGMGRLPRWTVLRVGSVAFVATLVLFCLPKNEEVAGQSRPVAAPLEPDILVLEPATGSRVEHNPFVLRGHNDGDRVRDGLTLRSRTTLGHLRLDRRKRFAVPVYMWADEEGSAFPLELRLRNGRGTGRRVATIDFRLPEYDLDGLEAELAAVDAAVEAGEREKAVDEGIELSRTLRDAGHPVLSRTVLDRLMPISTSSTHASSDPNGDSTPDETSEDDPESDPDAPGTTPHAPESDPDLPELDPARRVELLSARLELDVILGHPPEQILETAAQISKLEPEDRTTMIRAAQQLYTASDLALVSGYSRPLAQRVLAVANAFQKAAGRLPRRLLKGY